MVIVSKELVQKIAGLARVKLSLTQEKKFQKDFTSILGYFDVLSELDTKGVEPMTHAIVEHMIIRKDVPQKESSERVRKLLDMFPDTKNGYVKVQAILSQKE